MAEKKIEEAVVEETVSKAEYDKLMANYNRLASAFNMAMDKFGRDYAENLAKSIFAEVDKQAANKNN